MTKPKPPRKNKFRRRLSILLLAAGVALLGVAIGTKVSSDIWQAFENRVFNRETRTASRSPNPSRAPEKPLAPAPPPARGSLIGRLSIPRLGLTTMVREGDDDGTLRLALGHIPGTGMPGALGNVGIAGHRDTFFRPLREIKKNDLIRFETLAGEYDYRVDSTNIVKPDDVGVLRPGTGSHMTLVTCYPFYYIGAAPNRFIVSAHEVNGANPGNPLVAAAPRPAGEILPGDPAPERHRESLPQTLPGEDGVVRSGSRTVSFRVADSRSREVAPGILLGLTQVNDDTGRADGWMWVTPDRRTVLFKNKAVGDPVVFSQQGQRRELMITGISEGTVSGALLFASD